ncbi:MAG: hypothetical protein OXT67_04550 [Zetaproteobacteria bacterium]|nr:hypothetical protein [Zetaproteobacteria bacterium]
MIRKFLIVGKHIYLSTTKIEDEFGHQKNIDLVMPINVYWQALDEIRRADYLIVSGEPQADTTEIYRKIFRILRPYTVYEVDRTYLIRNSSQHS